MFLVKYTTEQQVEKNLEQHPTTNSSTEFEKKKQAKVNNEQER